MLAQIALMRYIVQECIRIKSMQLLQTGNCYVIKLTTTVVQLGETESLEVHHLATHNTCARNAAVHEVHGNVNIAVVRLEWTAVT